MARVRRFNKEYSKFVSNEHIAKMVKIIDISFQIFEDFLELQYPDNLTVAIAMREIVYRAHKSLQAIVLLSLSGLGIPAISHMRDLLELEFLVRYFILHPNEIETWWKADRKTRTTRYSAGALRPHIAQGDSRQKEKIDADYIGHCEIATHPTPESMQLQHKKEKNSSPQNPDDPAFMLFCITDTSFHAYSLSRAVLRYEQEIEVPPRYVNKMARKLDRARPSLEPFQHLSRYLIAIRKGLL
jgi:hypothetical protein